ncbi:MAG: DUF2279 domain-containing protein [Burkholderiales bacterium]|nr:DUF2279 domain-containing protein [Burkholderiales bacterium]
MSLLKTLPVAVLAASGTFAAANPMGATEGDAAPAVVVAPFAPADSERGATALAPTLASEAATAGELLLAAVDVSSAPPGTAAVGATVADATRQCQDRLRLPWGPVTQCKTAIVGSALGGVMLVSGLQWWRRGFGSSFLHADEGWFRRETYSGGLDKLGHVYTFYAGTRLLNQSLRWAGVPKGEALLTSMAVNFGTGALIELGDGYMRRSAYGFSKEDLASNTAGILLGALIETYPSLDRKFAYRMEFRPRGGQGGQNILDNYDSQRYYVAARLSGFMEMSKYNPLRYLELVFGYGATGFRPRDGQVAGVDYVRHERRTYYGVALNVEEVLRGTLFAGNDKPSRAQAISEGVLTYVQLPGTVFAKHHAF